MRNRYFTVFCLDFVDNLKRVDHHVFDQSPISFNEIDDELPDVINAFLTASFAANLPAKCIEGWLQELQYLCSDSVKIRFRNLFHSF